MTLPEIPKEKKEQTKITCQFCGKEGVTKAHERFCSSNPNNPRTKKNVAMKPDKAIAPPASPAEPLIIITDIQPCLYGEEAVYDAPEGKIYKHVGNIGILHTDRNESIPCALVMASNGILTPVFMIDGFVGMFLRGSQDMNTSIPDEEEAFPPFPIDEEKEINARPTISEESKELIEASLNASGC